MPENTKKETFLPILDTTLYIIISGDTNDMEERREGRGI